MPNEFRMFWLLILSVKKLQFIDTGSITKREKVVSQRQEGRGEEYILRRAVQQKSWHLFKGQWEKIYIYARMMPTLMIEGQFLNRIGSSVQ